MASPQASAAPTAPASPPAPAYAWSARWRMLASLLLLLHLLAVFVAPLSGPPPASMLSQMVAAGLEPYLAAADLNHGYRFFAPNPGASSLVQYELVMPDGTREELQFPSVEQHWPRLLYHRHFMIAETINFEFRQLQQLRQPVEFPPLPPDIHPRDARIEFSRRDAMEGERLRNLAETEERLTKLLAALSQELLTTSGAERVELKLVSHEIADPELVLAGVPIDDARWYREIPMGSLSEGEAWTWSKESYEPPERLLQ